MWEQVKQALAQSTTRFLTRFANLLPGMAALIVALLLSVILAWILAIIVRRLLASLHFDERLGRWGFASLAEWSPMNSPTLSGVAIDCRSGHCHWISDRDCGFRLRMDLSACARASSLTFPTLWPLCWSCWSATSSLAFLPEAC